MQKRVRGFRAKGSWIGQGGKGSPQHAPEATTCSGFTGSCTCCFKDGHFGKEQKPTNDTSQHRAAESPCAEITRGNRMGIAHFTGPSCQRRIPESKHVDRLLASSPKLKRRKLELTDSQKSFWEAQVGSITSCNVVLSVSLEVYVLLYKLGSSDTRQLLPVILQKFTLAGRPLCSGARRSPHSFSWLWSLEPTVKAFSIETWLSI